MYLTHLLIAGHHPLTVCSNVTSMPREDSVEARIVLRNNEGKAAYATRLRCTPDPYLAEIMAFKEALTWFKERDVQHVIVELDCLNLCTCFYFSCNDLSYGGLFIQQ